VISFILPGAKSLSTRKKIMVACWPSPSEGSIYLRQPVRVEKVQKIIEEYSKEGKTHLSMTHFVIKACGEMLKKADDLNGYFSFGKVTVF
jgi:pyruvate/2-oxoglutarate dehydrogenase complex dihydrolipoamide acyltransferase (E2) component